MTEDGAAQVHDRQSFEDQGSNFLRQNRAEKPEFDYAENRPPRSHSLAGTTVTLVLRDKPEQQKHTFTQQDVTVEVESETGPPHSLTAPYEAFEMAPGIFFVAYLAGETRSVAMALDRTEGAATMIIGDLTTEGIVSTVESAALEEVATARSTQQPVYHPPFSLGGTRFLNTYAHNVAYEHIYLTGVYETWLGVKGPQAGQADTEEYHAFKIADGIYLLYWNEGILTTQMTFLFNFIRGDCVAQVFARVDGDLVHNTIGADTRLIHTKLPELPDVARLDIYSGE